MGTTERSIGRRARRVTAIAVALFTALAVAAPSRAGQPAADEPRFLEVRVVAGTTGETLPGVRVALAKPPAKDDDGAFADVSGLHRRAVTLPGSRSRGDRFPLRVDLPGGWALEDGPAPQVRIEASTVFTRAFRAHLVAWPEAPIRVRVVEASGEPAAGAVAECVSAREWTEDRGDWTRISVRRWGRTDADADGRVVLRGVPAIPGARVRVQATLGIRRAISGTFEVDAITADEVLEVVLPAAPGSIRSPGVRGTSSHASGCGGGGAPGGGSAALELEVRTVGGEPARDVEVLLLGAEHSALGNFRRSWRMTVRTDAAGIARVLPLPRGTVDVHVIEPGFLQEERVRVDLVSGGMAVRRITEERGVPCALRVRLGDGTPRPGIRVTFGPTPVLDATGVQWLDVVTDGDGVAIVPRLLARVVGAQVRLGERSCVVALERGAVAVDATLPATSEGDDAR